MTRAAQQAGRADRRVAAAVAAAVVAAAVGGCTGGDDPTVPTAGGAPTTAVTAAEDPHAQELAFVACMREEGVEDMPDPTPGDTSGRSSVRHALDVMGKGLDPLFQAALDKCMSLLPPAPPPKPASAEEIEAQRQFAQCMRENGLPDFPDPQGDSWGFSVVAGGQSQPLPAVTIVEGVVVLNIGDPVANAAWEACLDLLPQTVHE